MIKIILNEPNFEYDIYSLVKAFYPEEEVSIEATETQIDCVTSAIYLLVNYKENLIKIQFWHKKEEILASEISVNHADRKETKNCLKRLLYRMLSEYSRKELPWGTLTGIRPTKIPMAFLEEGISTEKVKEILKTTYLISDEKADLCIEIPLKELEILKNIDYKNGYSLYIGIPFCPSTCLYCSFTSFPVAKWKDRMQEYLKALKKEILFTAKTYSDKVLNTIYIGGGTPTSLSAEQMDSLLTLLEENFDYSNLQEFTLEAGRPDSITKEKLEVIKAHKVTRISINPQTMNQETLTLIGRHHTVQETINAFRLARELGFDNINMDLIVGLPNETKEDICHTMEEITKLNPDSVTVHTLAIKRAARLRMEQEHYKELEMNKSPELIGLTAEYCRNLNMSPYYLYRQKMAGNLENVGYAKWRKEGIYNILIMEEKQTIVALGAGTSSKFVSSEGQIERVENVKDVDNYLTRIDEMIERKRKFMMKKE